MKSFSGFWRIPSLLLAVTALGFSQRPSNQVGPGTINYVEGQVSTSNRLQPGETLSVGNGYAEILLTPGAFLRVGHNSEVRLVSAGLADSQIQLIQGTAILEADQMIKGSNLSVTMNGATTQIEKNGLYSFDVPQQAVMVLDGKARVQAANGSQTLDKHDEVLLASDKPLKRRGFDAKAVESQPLYVWSKVRSEDVAQASAVAARNANIYTVSPGGWYWDPALNFYGFWPASAYLYSPFGFGFYSPAFYGFGYYGNGFYRTPYYYRGWTGVQVHGMSARMGGFHGGGRR